MQKTGETIKVPDNNSRSAHRPSQCPPFRGVTSWGGIGEGAISGLCRIAQPWNTIETRTLNGTPSIVVNKLHFVHPSNHVPHFRFYVFGGVYTFPMSAKGENVSIDANTRLPCRRCGHV